MGEERVEGCREPEAEELGEGCAEEFDGRGVWWLLGGRASGRLGTFWL